MSRQKPGLYVPDFSTLNGTSTRKKQTLYRYKRTTSPTWTNSPDMNIIGIRYKKAPVAGSRSPGGYKKATNYSRIIHTCVNPDQFFSWETRNAAGTATTVHELNCPIGGQGVVLADGGIYSTTGAVNVNQNYIDRALVEAYAALVDAKINLGTALAELGETLGWLANLVRRLTEILLIVKDALKGKISRAAAHRKIYGNANRIQPRTRVTNNRWKAMPTDLTPAARRWRQDAQRKWWNDEVYARYLRGEQRRARRALGKQRPTSNKVSSAWLEYQYALMPLVYDIYGTVEALREGLRGSELLFSVQRTIGGPLDPSKLVAASGAFEASGSVRQSARVVYVGRLDPTLLSAMVELGLTNPWAIAWELVPFSFVIDWLVPIGPLLDSFTAPLGVHYVDGYLDRLVYGSFEATRTQPGSGLFIKGDKPSARIKILAFRRSTFLTWPIAGLYMRSPFSYAHVATTIALVTQLTKR